MAAHHQIIRYASEKGMLDTPRTTLVAAIVQGSTRHLGALRRLAAVRGARRRAAHPHARPLLPRAAERRRRSAWTGSTATSCSPAWARPPSRCSTSPARCTLQQGDKHPAVLRRPVGQPERRRHRAPPEHASRSSEAVPDLVETALRNGGDHSDNVTVIALEWETPDAFESTARHFHRQHQRRRVRLHHPGRRARHHGRRPRRRRHRALDRRDQRSHPPLGRPQSLTLRAAGVAPRRAVAPFILSTTNDHDRISYAAATAPPTSCARCASPAASPSMPKARC